MCSPLPTAPLPLLCCLSFSTQQAECGRSTPSWHALIFCLRAELEHHLGIADKTLAEFIIELSKGKGR